MEDVVEETRYSISTESVEKLENICKNLEDLRIKALMTPSHVGSEDQSLLNFIDGEIHDALTSVKLIDTGHLKEVSVFKNSEKMIFALEIHPSLLQGLIPVSKPEFCDDRGGMRTCICGTFKYYDGSESMSFENMLLVRRAVDSAIEREWRYIFAIFKNDDDNFVVQGC